LNQIFGLEKDRTNCSNNSSICGPYLISLSQSYKSRETDREREREREREIVCKSDLMRVRGGESVVGSLGDLDPLQA
jgi:hypothetical protein